MVLPLSPGSVCTVEILSLLQQALVSSFVERLNRIMRLELSAFICIKF